MFSPQEVIGEVQQLVRSVDFFDAFETFIPTSKTQVLDVDQEKVSALLGVLVEACSRWAVLMKSTVLPFGFTDLTFDANQAVFLLSNNQDSEYWCTISMQYEAPYGCGEPTDGTDLIEVGQRWVNSIRGYNEEYIGEICYLVESLNALSLDTTRRKPRFRGNKGQRVMATHRLVTWLPYVYLYTSAPFNTWSLVYDMCEIDDELFFDELTVDQAREIAAAIDAAL